MKRRRGCLLRGPSLAAAGHAIYGRALIIVDFGTATTLCAISRHGEYLGGAISPGLLISAEALFTHTAKIPKIDLARPKTVIGRDTASSMQSGILIGFACMVDGLIEQMRKEMDDSPRVIATGGLASLILPVSKAIQEIRPHLTLEGLRILYEKNRHRGQAGLSSLPERFDLPDFPLMPCLQGPELLEGGGCKAPCPPSFV